MEWLHDKLKEYVEADYYPFHMPGSKRNFPEGGIFPFSYDITEIDGFDDLRSADGILSMLQDEWAGMYQAAKAYLSVNGSTAGNLSLIAASTEDNPDILVVNDCHWSVTNAIELLKLNAIFLEPHRYEEGFCKAIGSDDIAEVFDRNPEIGTVVITSPTYEGIVSDIESISKVVHERGARLIVDSAHGAHIGLNGITDRYGFKNPVSQGVDGTVVSLHKTLPVPGQVSLILFPHEDEYSERVKHFLNIFQTSSPSYVLMAGASEGLKLLKEDGSRLYESYRDNISEFREKCRSLDIIRIVESDNMEMSKIIITTNNYCMTGYQLAETLRRDHRIEIEKSCDRYVIAMTSIMDTKVGFDRLFKALTEIDKRLG